jgi:hypothetical protein
MIESVCAELWVFVDVGVDGKKVARWEEGGV